MPEVQKPVLEHATTEAQNAQVEDSTLPESNGVVKLVTSVTTGVWLDEARTRFAMDGVRPWQECDCFSEAAASGNYD
jgi:hypothetical protein